MHAKVLSIIRLPCNINEYVIEKKIEITNGVRKIDVRKFYENLERSMKRHERQICRPNIVLGYYLYIENTYLSVREIDLQTSLNIC